MINIQVAGAGAGKTFGLAGLIKIRTEERDGKNKIHALTYTNSAKEKIRDELTRSFNRLPEYINIDTVHSFLLNEIIFPYAQYVLGDRYHSVSLETLPTENVYKNSRIAKLKKDGVIHVENVYKTAKQILDRNNSKHTNKYKKGKVDYITNLLSKTICSIFIDEVQDLDSDCLRVFEILGKTDIYIYMIGDPKQAIKYPNALHDFIESIKKTKCDKITIKPMENNTRRVPQAILNISNKFCYDEQCQTTLNTLPGEVRYIYNEVERYDEMLGEMLTRGKLVIINQKNDFYTTKKENKQHIPWVLSNLISESDKRAGRDTKLYIQSVYFDLIDELQINNHKMAVNNIIRKHNLSGLIGERKDLFAIFYTFAEACISTEHQVKYIVKSIEAVKGLDSDIVFFILTDSFINYLDGVNLTKDQHFNKEWKKIYVALTRSKDKLIFVLDKRMISPEHLTISEKFFKENNIKIISDADECLSWL